MLQEHAARIMRKSSTFATVADNTGMASITLGLQLLHFSQYHQFT
jgi:hypothetical protein